MKVTIVSEPHKTITLGLLCALLAAATTSPLAAIILYGSAVGWIVVGIIEWKMESR